MTQFLGLCVDGPRAGMRISAQTRTLKTMVCGLAPTPFGFQSDQMLPPLRIRDVEYSYFKSETGQAFWISARPLDQAPENYAMERLIRGFVAFHCLEKQL